MSGRGAHLEAGLEVELTHLRTQRKVVATVGELLGEGGTARVYAATLEDGSGAVLKVQRAAGEPDPAFALELELFRQLAHRNILACVGAGGVDGLLVLAFRRAYSNPLLLMTEAAVVEGMRRDKKARYPSLPLDTAVDLGYELLNALAYLEQLGLVHHDVKLANLLIDPGPRDRPLKPSEVFGVVARRHYRAVLIDFGATRTRATLEAWNRGESPGGPAPQITPFYAPPEAVVEARRADGTLGYVFHPSQDVYAAALVIYAMVTGHPPYNHLRTPLAPDDLEGIVGIKSAERRGDVTPIALETIQRVVFEETRFTGGDRAAFDLALFRFLQRRLDPDPAKRGTSEEMKRDFERLARIERNEPGKLDPRGPRVVLPFRQGLAQVGSRADHPLLRAARLHGGGEAVEEPATGVRSTSGRTPRPAPAPRASSTREGASSEGRPLPARRHTRRLPRLEEEATTPLSPEVIARARSLERPRTAPQGRSYPAPPQAQAPHFLVSAVLDQPFLLMRERGRTLIGRAPDSDVRIKSDRVSRQHADVRWDGRAFVLADLRSTNGTALNGQPLTAPTALHDGDRISVGGFELEVRVLARGQRPDAVDDDGGGETRAYRGGDAAADAARLAAPALAGTLGQLSIKDLLELLEWKRHSGTLTLEPPRLPPGYLYFREGRIHHAKAGRLVGIEAAVRLLRVAEGRFSFAHGATQAPDSIERDHEQLLELAAGERRA